MQLSGLSLKANSPYTSHMADEEEQGSTLRELVAIYNRAPDLFKALALEDSSWIGKPCTEDDYLRLDANQKSSHKDA